MSERPEIVDLLSRQRRALQSGSGGGTSDGMETRVTRLEEQMAGVARDVRDIRESLKVLSDLPTKRDLDGWRTQWIAIGVGIVALTVGGITGGLALISRQTPMAPSPATPIVVQIPYSPALASQASPPRR